MTASTTLRVNAQISIPRSEIRFSFVRSSGPGGQNVNKVASKAVLRWPIESSASLAGELKARVIHRLGRRINDRGELVLASQRYRDQAKNIEDCLDKLRDLVSAAATVPKKRKKTLQPKGAREARLRQKRRAGEKKLSRRRPAIDD